MDKKHLEYSGVVKPILNFLNSLPKCKAINIHGSVYTERGTPDIMGCIDGSFFVFECKKSNKEKLSPIQEYRICQYIKANAIVGAVSSVNDVKLILFIMGILHNE